MSLYIWRLSSNINTVNLEDISKVEGLCTVMPRQTISNFIFTFLPCRLYALKNPPTCLAPWRQDQALWVVLRASDQQIVENNKMCEYVHIIWDYRHSGYPFWQTWKKRLKPSNNAMGNGRCTFFRYCYHFKPHHPQLVCRMELLIFLPKFLRDYIGDRIMVVEFAKGTDGRKDVICYHCDNAKYYKFLPWA